MNGFHEGEASTSLHQAGHAIGEEQERAVHRVR